MAALNILYPISEKSMTETLVSAYSVIKNNSSTDINFYFMHTEEFDKNSTAPIYNLKKHNNCLNVQFIKIDSAIFQNLSEYIKIVAPIWLFQIPNLINSDKILYITSNTLITSSLKELYETDMDNCPSAASEYVFSDKFRIRTGLEKKYVYSPSVLLLNLKFMREKDYLNKLLSYDFSKFAFDDTPLSGVEAFNIVIDNIKRLDLKYNYTEIPTAKKPSFSIQAKADYKKFLSHIETPVVIFFMTSSPVGKKACQNSYMTLWWEYAKQTEIYEKIKDHEITNKYKLSATSAKNSFKYSWLLSRIWPYIRPYMTRIIIGFLIAIPLGLLDGVTALALKPYMDYVVAGKPLHFSRFGIDLEFTSSLLAFLIPFGVVCFAALQGVLRYLNSYLAHWTSWHISNGVKIDLFHHLVNMHPQFYDDNTSGIIISRYVNDPGTASNGIVEQIKTITTSLCGAIGLIAVMLYSSWRLAFIGVIVLCIAFVPVALMRRRIKEASNKGMVVGGNITTNMNETYSGNKVMTSYNLQQRQENYFKSQIWRAYDINMSLLKRSAWMSPLMYQIAAIGIAIVLGYGTYLINQGEMTPGSFASFITSLLLLYKPIKTLGNTMTSIQNIFVAMGRVFELFDLNSIIKEKENPLKFKDFSQNITFNNVVFEYISGKPVLKNLNLTVNKNETIAIVGNSGGGKSTLVNLIPRFYDVKSGSIKIDGVDIRDFSLKSLRNGISMVFQDNFLFSGTIKDNIMMGKPSATTEELMVAIKSAHLEDFIENLSLGLDTKIGERGLTLSGGQRQRVAIARALLKKAPIVILDEATSALDNESEAIVQKAMDNLIKDKTVFIIAHRLSTIKNADRIIVVNEGEIVEEGCHSELINIENGQYKHLYEMQFKKNEILSEIK